MESRQSELMQAVFQELALSPIMEERQSELMQVVLQQLVLSPMILSDDDEQETTWLEFALIREADEGEEVCCICFHRFANAVLAPCTHKDFCWYCAHKVLMSSRKCPLCRTYIENLAPLYPMADDLNEEERHIARCMEIASYDERELYLEYALELDTTMEEALAYAAECREILAAWGRGEY